VALVSSASAFLFTQANSGLTRLSMTTKDSFFLMKNPWKNKGSSFSNKERDELGLQGLLPNGEPLSLELKVQLSMENLRKKTSPLEKYLYLHGIQDSDETLFYAILAKHTHETMPLVYTPTVGAACVEWSHIYRQQPRGVYLSTKHLGKVQDILKSYPIKDIKVIVFTDGERILGLGDLGSNGMGIPIGKLALYTTCAGIHPEQCLPVMLDVGTNTDSILQDPYYVGVRQKRDRSEKYDQLVEEFVTAAQTLYGRDVLLQFEDFGNSNAFRLLDKYKPRSTCFNDDIQGTASVVVAGMQAALPMTPYKHLKEHTYLFFGAGEAGIGIADLLVSAMAKESGLNPQKMSKEDFEAKMTSLRQRCWFVDSKGLITSARLNHPIEHHKIPYAHPLPDHHHEPVKTLVEAVKIVKPTALVGVSAQGQTFTKEVVTQMLEYSPNPLIFALSNPTTKAECTAEQAYTWTNGKAVFASGSPFDPVTLASGKQLVPGQGNNAYIFPGVGLGALISKALSITDDDFLVAAEALASLVSDERRAQGCVYPELKDIRYVSQVIAARVAQHIYETGRSQLPSAEKHQHKSHTQWMQVAHDAMYVPKY
jgi:malate dehydrogenase (oxaloacetate-decarboxylating)(NADP+)